jgi:hypothetical protein
MIGCCQAVASSGLNCVVPRSKPTKPLKSCDLTLPVLVLSHKLGSKPSGLESAQWTSGLARAAPPVKATLNKAAAKTSFHMADR